MTAEELRAKYHKDLEALQASCPHPKSELMPYSFAPGHFAGCANVCLTCEKIVDSCPHAHTEFKRVLSGPCKILVVQKICVKCKEVLDEREPDTLD